jgi:hypothetical protein
MTPARTGEYRQGMANIYDLGWRRNLVEVLAARSQQRRPEPPEPAEKEAEAAVKKAERAAAAAAKKAAKEAKA